MSGEFSYRSVKMELHYSGSTCTVVRVRVLHIMLHSRAGYCYKEGGNYYGTWYQQYCFDRTVAVLMSRVQI